MAAVKKKFKLKGKSETDAHAYAEFVGDMLAGTITAVKLYDTERENGKLKLEYDEP